uniref:Rhodanese domain-containing protein n=1 Tax=Haptolina ericina TaxID=156174 RepID=A0A7S3B532_9EUKA|mmetsp:Transcript_51443/g.115540  ORF Transcript_51443/g.115540 Transcript_51443/m.115540 type:complete len:120 (+) Transcript_51443:606-965(+)
MLPGAAQAGRIPWASARLEWSCFRQADGRWRDPEEIREIAAELMGAAPGDGGGPHYFYCQSGVRTTQLIFGLALADWPLRELLNYDGSWVEWSHQATADEVLVVPREEVLACAVSAHEG